MWLAWDTAAVISLCLVAVSLLAGSARRGWAIWVSVLAKECAVVLGLYAVWQRIGTLAVTKVTGAVGHAMSIWYVERFLHFPSEVRVQRAVLPFPLVVRALNAYYAIAHVPALIIFLIWLFIRHRDRYSWWRNTGALLTGVSLVIQMIPVAPPRLVPGLGFVDTAVQYRQSVYGPAGISVAPQLAAMPSVHVAWAVFIAAAVIACSTSPWRWLVLAHAALTVTAVVATANHWWLDAVAGATLLPLAALTVQWMTSFAARYRRRPGSVVNPAPVAVLGHADAGSPTGP
jgi:hypothetical protein